MSLSTITVITMSKTVVVIFFVVLHYGLTAFMKNKYMAEIEMVETCPNNDKLVTPLRNLKFNRYNRTHKTLSYDFTYDRPLDGNIGGNISVDRWGDGGWITVPFMGFQQDICRTVLRFFKAAWVTFHRLAGVPHPDSCPLPAGNYSLKNYMLDTSQASPIPFWSGRFRFTSMYQDVTTNELMHCIMYIIKVTEVF